MESHAGEALELVFEPTSAASILNVHRYLNHNTAKEPNAMTQLSTIASLVTRTKDETDTEVAMNYTRANSSGRAVVGFQGRVGARAEGVRWATVGLQGFQGASQVKLYGMGIHGVAG